MKIEQTQWTAQKGWNPNPPGTLSDAQLVLIFGGTEIIKDSGKINEIKQQYPNAYVTGCSTAGEICGTTVADDSLVVTAVQFDSTRLEHSSIKVKNTEDSFKAGEELAKAVSHEGLVHLLVLSDGSVVNGSELVKGITRNLPSNVTVTGGLAGDGARFKETIVVADGIAHTHLVSVVGLYGSSIKVGYGSLGGWDSFGPERLITRSRANTLYELDGRSALELYKTYLGEHAEGLPATGLLFPLSLREDADTIPVVRTILSVNEEEQSLTFAGDIPQGSYVRLMKANFDRLIDGAAGAATTSHHAMNSTSSELAILISCVGRKLVLDQRIEEEVESVREVLGEETVLTGFYSYGEISPFTPNAKCELHNQTMTITTLSEK